MDRDGTPRYDEDPTNQTGPLGIEWRDEAAPSGDVLSDGWHDGQEPGPPSVSGATEIVPADVRPLDPPGPLDPPDPEGSRAEGWPDHDDPGNPPEERRGFLGSGWRGEEGAEEEGRSQNSRLILAMIAVVVLAVAGGWIVSSSASPTPEAGCAAPADCATAQPIPAASDSTVPDPATPPAVDPEITPEGSPTTPGETPAAVPTGVRSQNAPEPTTEPTPTRTRPQSPKPTPRTSEPRQDDDEQPRIEDEPTPTSSPTPPPPPPTTKPPAPSPTKERPNGLLDWLF
ncbi:hypothetical protein [Sphaerisporangium aureirubrum]|uniref:Uncharacterized protein n=1 Tax=Sphaerisporangium aureirubrum TaxID=1544736 RepID=A0ABW1NPD2_9ACTN